jgi:hypothetical protein
MTIVIDASAIWTLFKIQAGFIGIVIIAIFVMRWIENNDG